MYSKSSLSSSGSAFWQQKFCKATRALLRSDTYAGQWGLTLSLYYSLSQRWMNLRSGLCTGQPGFSTKRKEKSLFLSFLHIILRWLDFRGQDSHDPTSNKGFDLPSVKANCLPKIKKLIQCWWIGLVHFYHTFLNPSLQYRYCIM